jgi:hypothetical protein
MFQNKEKMKKRNWVKNHLGHIGYIEENRFCGFSYKTDIMNEDKYTKPSQEEINEFLKKEKENLENCESRLRKEVQLLFLCGLSHSDFVRFRDVEREGDKLIVWTRENGVNERSVDAIRNKHYLNSCADDFDSTYERYEFEIPTSYKKWN